MKKTEITGMRNWAGSPGFTLIEVMIAAAIGAIVLLAMMSWTDNMLIQQKSMSQKMVSLSIANTLQMLVSNQTECTDNLGPTGLGLTWPTAATSATIASALQIYNSVGASVGTAVPLGTYPNGYGLQISSITLQNITQIVPNTYTASLVVSFTNTVIPLQPLTMPGLVLTTNTAGPNQKVQSCGGAQMMTGYSGLLSSTTGSNCTNPPGSGWAGWAPVPGGSLGVGKSCIAYVVERSGGSGNFQSFGCAYDAPTGQVYYCQNGPNAFFCGWTCLD